MKKILFYLCLGFINHILKGNRFYNSKRKVLNMIGCSIAENVRIVGPIQFHYGTKLEVGKGTFIGTSFTIHGNGNIIIGEECDIAPEVIILTGSHELGNHYKRAGKGYCENVSIGSGCWICARACILPGKQIGDGCVVAAQSLVNKNIADDYLVGGVPARPIRKLSE